MFIPSVILISSFAENIGVVANGMAKRLSELDPANASFYTGNAATFRNQLQRKLREWQTMPFSGKRFIAYHRFFEYLSNEFGFSIVGYIEAKPGIPPSAGHLQQLIDLSRQAKPDAILTTAYHSRQQADALSSRTGLTVIMVPHEVGSTAQVKDWFLRFRCFCFPPLEVNNMDALNLLIYPFLGCVALILIHAYFGIHVLERGIIFVDLSLA